MKQDFKKIQEQMELREESKIDIIVAQCFWRAGWKVYPEAGHRFQLKRNYEDCDHTDSISNDEAKDLFIEFLRVSNAETETQGVHKRTLV